MKTVCLVLLECVIASLLFSQQLPPVLSGTPTAPELSRFFSDAGDGRRDLFQCLGLVHERGENAVPGLVAVLNTDNLRVNRLYASMALEHICSPAAIAGLQKAAQSDPDIEVRAAALNALATTYYDKVVTDRLTPDKEIVQLLMRCADDTTAVDYLKLSLGKVARIGLQNWMGRDFGEPSTGVVRVKVGQTIVPMTLPEYREFWWQKYGNRLRWNWQSGHFEMP